MQQMRDKIRVMLLCHHLTQAWLVNRLEYEGVQTDKTELSSVLRGTRKGNKADLIIQKSVLILKDYEEKMCKGKKTNG